MSKYRQKQVKNDLKLLTCAATVAIFASSKRQKRKIASNANWEVLLKI
jgi:hypothetical protein